MDYTELTQVLLWLVGIGSPTVVGYVLSWVVENWKSWSTFPKEVKVIVPMIVSVSLSVGAKYLLNFPDILAQISPYFTMVMTAILTYLSTQKAYLTAMSKGYGARFYRPNSRNKQELPVKTFPEG